MAVELTAQEIARGVDGEGHTLRRPDRGAAAHLVVRRPTIDRSAIIIMWTKMPLLELFPSMTQVQPALLVWA